MALTQIDTGGIKDDAVTDAKLPANSVGNSEMKDDAVGVAELSATGTASSSTFLRGDNSWQAISTTPEGTAVLSTGETGTAKFLRVDGDNSCSWQVPPDTNTQLAFANDANNRVVTGDGSGGLNGEANLVFDGTNLGVNTTSPTVGYGGDVGLHIHSSATSGTRGSSIHLTSGTSGTTAADGSRINTSDNDLVIQNMENGRLDLGTNGAHRLTIKGDGKIGIGTDSPGQQLHLKAPSNATTLIQIEASPTGDGTAGFIGCIASANNLSNGSLAGELALRGSSGISFSANEGSTTQLRLASGGNLTLTDGDIIIGTAGHGIDFGATSDASGASSEKLDDYEEGTWTPTVGTTSSTTANGEYTKIGRLVHIKGFVSWGSHGNTGTDSVVFGGLPFTPAGVGYLYMGDSRWINLDSNMHSVAMYANSSGINFKENGDNTNAEDLKWSQLGNDTFIGFSGFYHV